MTRRSRGRSRTDAISPPASWPHAVHLVVMQALALARSQGGGAGEAARMVLAARSLHSRHRSRAGDDLFDLARLAARLDARIAFALHETGRARKLSIDERERLRYAALLAAERGVAPPDVARLLMLDEELVRLLADPRFLDGLAGAERLAVEHAMPRWLVESLLRQFSDEETGALLGALNERAPLFVRARGDRERLLARLSDEGVPAQPAPFSPLGVEITRHVNVRALKSFKDGSFEVQDLGSQLIAMAVAPKAGEAIVDACAGAGGKTLALSAMCPDCDVIAFEPGASRIASLNARASRVRAHVTAVHAGIGERATARFLGKADAVLVDAPCSGTGALRREPLSRWRYGPGDIAQFSATQERITREAIGLLRPGGRLVYATCSLLREEDEDVVTRVLESAGGLLDPLPLVELLGPIANELGARGHLLHLLPHLHRTDGFFIAAMRRTR